MRVKQLLFSLVILSMTPVSSQAKPKEYLAKGMFSLTQKDLPKSFTKKDTRVVEGCGPIAVAMVLGYWQTDKGEGSLLTEGEFNGKVTGGERPAKDIRRIYRALKSYKVIGSHMSYTPTRHLVKGLAKLVASRKLKVNRSGLTTSWKDKVKMIKRALRKGEPVIVRKEKEHKDGCIGEDSNGWNFYKNVANDHYYVLTGYKGDEVAVLPGGSDKDRGKMRRWKTYEKNANSYAHRVCTFEQLKKDKVTVITLSRSSTRYCTEDAHCGSKQWCKKKRGNMLLNKCQQKLKKGKKCANTSACLSGKCKWRRCK